METKSFSKYIAVLYCFETEVGKEILSGAIIKTNAQPDTQEIESIAHRVAQMTPMLKKNARKTSIMSDTLSAFTVTTYASINKR